MTDITPDADDTDPEMFTCGNSRCGRAYDPTEGEDEIFCSQECRREDADAAENLVIVEAPAVAALNALSEELLEARDRITPHYSPRNDGRRYGLEEAATRARSAADRLAAEAGESTGEQADDVDLVHHFLATGAGDPHGNVLGVEGDVITLKAPGRVLRITVTRS